MGAGRGVGWCSMVVGGLGASERGALGECWGGLKVDIWSAQWGVHSAARVRCGGWVRRSGGDDMGRGCDFTMGDSEIG